MKRLLPALSLLVCAAVHAQSQRTFVSSAGNDANACSRTAPCRNFSVAVAAVADGGEVIALDSAGYGPLSITKAVSIIAPAGIYAGITATTGNAIDINTAGIVTLHGLFLNALGADNAISIAGADVVHVENVAARAFQTYGVIVSSINQLYVTDSVIRDGGGGIFIAGGGVIFAAIERCRIEHTAGQGIFFAGAVFSRAVIRECTLTKNVGAAINSANPTIIKDCTIVGNGQGIATSGGVITVSRSIVMANTVGFQFNGSGSISSYGNNEVAINNTTESGGTVTAIAPQ